MFKRKWYLKKTNWAILMGLSAKIMTMIPFAAPYAGIALTIAGALGTYGIADRAGKPPEI